MAYVDGFVLAVPKGSWQRPPISRRRQGVGARRCSRYPGECVGDDLRVKMGVPFPRLAKVRPGETVVFSWIINKSRAARDRVTQERHEGASNGEGMKQPMPFEVKRMSYGGFRSGRPLANPLPTPWSG